MIPKITVSSHRLTHAKVRLNIAPRREAVATLLRTGRLRNVCLKLGVIFFLYRTIKLWFRKPKICDWS